MSSLKRNIIKANKITLCKVEKLLKVQFYPRKDYSKRYFAKTAIKQINNCISHKRLVTDDANHAKVSQLSMLSRNLLYTPVGVFLRCV